MKAKKEFYHFGNDRKFNDEYTISIMTGEPMPRKWQEFFELTPEEKARWDASLKLDEEYRIAEAQGFPNGIPGGRTRGDMLYYFTQREEERKRKWQEENLRGRFFTPRKTEMHNNNEVVPNNAPVYGQTNTQPTVTFKQKLNTESPYTRQNNLLQMNTGIKKEPAFGREQARQLQANSEAQAKMSSSLMQRGESLQGNQNINDMISKNLSNQRIRDAIIEDRRGSKMKNGETAGVRERAVIQYINLSNGEIVPYVVITSNAVLGSSYNSGTYDDSNDALATSSGYRVEESKQGSTISSNSTNIRNATGKISNNDHDTADGYSGNYEEGTVVPVTDNTDEKESFWDIFCRTTGQYGDLGTVPLITLFDASNPDEVRALIRDLQQYEPYIQAAADRVYKNLPDIACEAVSLVIPKLPPHLRGTALGALIIFGICLCAKEAYDEWDETTGKEGFVILFSDKLMFYFTEEWAKNITDTFGIPKKYSRPIFLVVKNALN